MEKLSDLAWKKSKNVVHAIKKHPFNVKLAKGNLNAAQFCYYIEQDSLYLKDYSRSLAMIAARAPLEFVSDFLLFSKGALIAEQQMIHHFFQNQFQFQETGRVTPATVSYTSYLLQACSTGPVEVAIAAVLPCFWVYKEVGNFILNEAKETERKENPYQRWIDTYAGEEFGKGVKRAIAIFDQIADQASDIMKTEMLEAFYRSSVLEWHFWNDSYRGVVFDAF